MLRISSFRSREIRQLIDARFLTRTAGQASSGTQREESNVENRLWNRVSATIVRNSFYEKQHRKIREMNDFVQRMQGNRQGRQHHRLSFRIFYTLSSQGKKVPLSQTPMLK